MKSPSITSADQPEHTISVCRDCGVQTSGNLADDLASRLKENELVAGQYVVTLTSCMDFCPQGKITVVYPKRAGDGIEEKVFFVDPTGDDSLLIEALLHCHTLRAPEN